MNKNDMRNLWIVLSGANVGAPAGHVYAQVMDRVSHSEFEAAVAQARVRLLFQQLDPFHLGHLEIEQDDVDVARRLDRCVGGIDARECNGAFHRDSCIRRSDVR